MSTHDARGGSGPDTTRRLLWLGTYESDYPRTRVLVSGLRALGVDVDECHRPVWELTRHKAGSFLSLRGAPRALLRFAWAWLGLAFEQRRHPGDVDAVVAGYPAQPDALLAAWFARRRGAPLVIDAMISISDTLAGDRDRVGSTGGRLLRFIEGVALRRGERVLVDTEAHAIWFTDHLGIDPARIVVVPVGADSDVFRVAPPPTGAPYALFYGKLAPLHGLETVMAAAREPGTPPLRVIGEGQLGHWLDAELHRDHPPGLVHVPWVPFEQLATEVANASICLGVFGMSDKAARVVPNKVYQAMAVGRPIITADTPGVREVLTHAVDAWLVPAGDAKALAEALVHLAADRELRARLGAAAQSRFEEVGSPPMVARRLLAGLPVGRAVSGDAG